MDCQNVIQPHFIEELAALIILHGLEVVVAVNQPIHIDDGSVFDEISCIAAAGHANQRAGFGVTFQNGELVHVGLALMGVFVGHSRIYIADEDHPKIQT